MSRNESTAGLVLGLGAVLGLLADRLFPAGPEGLGFAIWLWLLGGAAVLVAWRAAGPHVGAVLGWSMVAGAAAVAMVLQETPILTLALWLVLVTSASMVLLRAGGVPLWATRPIDHLLGLALVPARAAFGVLLLLAELQPARVTSWHRLAAAVRGALLAAPLLLLFGALFAAADAGFDRYVVRAATFWSEDALEHVAFVLVFGWIAAGLLSGVRPTGLPGPLFRVAPPRLGVEETAIVFGLLALLFLTFVGFQLGYLFGGRQVIQATSGLTVAEYARRGFFELMGVGVATIGVLLAGDALTTARRVFRWLAAVLVASVLVMLVSAVQRLMLYTDAFGLSVDRITAAAVMAWVAAVLVLFAATVLRDRPGRFASGAAVAGIVTVFALVLVNPARVSAASNLDRAAAGVRAADVAYLTGLGADAVPTILGRIETLPPDARCKLSRALLSRWSSEQDRGDEGRDWRVWNAARAAARRAVQASETRLETIASGC